MSILEEIFTHKRSEVAARIAEHPVETLVDLLPSLSRQSRFIDALKRSTANRPALIAEVKHRSPSKGLLRENFDPITLAKSYAAHGAEAISVLTDEKYFGGHLDYLYEVNRALSSREPPTPTLRKDFIFSEYQLLEAAVAGASAVLLIAAMLSLQDLEYLIERTHELSMEPLVEIHNKAELQIAVSAGATLIGINNRDLHTFEVDLQTTLSLRPLVPGNIAVVSESGIKTAEHVRLLAEAGVDAMLIGESLVREQDPGIAIRRLREAG